MPATPSWPMDSGLRLFVEQEIRQGETIRLDGNAANYLANVMRLKPGDSVTLFDDITGSWQAEIVASGRRAVEVIARTRSRPREQGPDLWLCAAPIKRPRFDWMAEKACELGVRRFVPVTTVRAVVDKIKPDRLRVHMIEAAEQCERNALPELAELTPLKALMSQWPSDRVLYFCDERLHASEAKLEPLPELMRRHGEPAAVLIGPEGGFTDEENRMIRAQKQAVPVSLGPRILRAETAALAAVSTWMASAGDWTARHE